MESYKRYSVAKAEKKRASDWLGNKEKIDSQSHKPYSLTSMKFSVQYAGQAYAGATNYHDSPAEFNAAMAEVIKRNFAALSADALALLAAKERAALVACKGDLEAVQAQIVAAECEADTTI
ncbi:hypothetical protein ASF84_05235 [Pseudomonas sp. Leaf127]|uniref:hypothetical protein n=1 Tax=Pseudomonas sp. Leaf127 TaxID=1736267 RepID=UPI0007028019|nr:hypothetical protein [Pseudomonas sp. Leaf127]KQQ60115.1 hypothetical protein ASF84_05235 [Pseudomonas sp. Leaf127]